MIQALPSPSSAGSANARWAATASVFGTVLWLAAPFAPTAAAPSFGSLEHVFVFMPLTAAPLALLLLSALADPAERSSAPVRIAQHLQPGAAAMVLASFFASKGPLAGGLAAGWMAVALLVASGAGRLRFRAEPHFSNVSLLCAHLFLPIGAGWLVLSRLGVAPRGFSELTVLLAALHFHFSGFTLQLLIAATGRRLGSRPAWLPVLQRCLAIGAIAGIPLIASGNMLPSPLLKFLGVTAMVLSTSALAITSMAVAIDVRARAPRLLVSASAASLVAAMVLAGVYGVGELTARAWIGIPEMVASHGLLNALGFTLCGLLGHVRLQLASGRPANDPTAHPSPVTH